jgi:hypothetical protein
MTFRTSLTRVSWRNRNNYTATPLLFILKLPSKLIPHLVESGDLKNILGYAGTGKSRLLRAARELWEKEGYRVLGATLWENFWEKYGLQCVQTSYYNAL